MFDFWICALMKNSTSDSASQATTTSANHLRTRPTVIGPRGSRGRPAPPSRPSRSPRRRRLSGVSPPRSKSRGRARYFVYCGGGSDAREGSGMSVYGGRKMPSRWVIGVDLGGTKVLAGAVDDGLRVHHRARRLVRGTDRSTLLDTVAEAVLEARNAAPTEAGAVGVGLPAVLDLERTARFSTHLPLEGVPFADELRERVGLPVSVDNDTNLALLAEHRAGSARGARHALMLTLGTGIGGALLVDGELYRGARGGAGELGHVVVDVDGPRCQGKCPNRGCLEVMASGTALEREAAALAGRRPGSGLAEAAARDGWLTGTRVTELA